MPDVIHGTVSWPGVVAVEEFQYSVGHGITPGTALLRIQPQATPVAQFGDLTITDGNETVVVPGCRLDDLRVEKGEGGEYWFIRLVDRRWRWGNLGAVSGLYNQLDPNGKLIPWTIRSPTELAELCLQAMGETNYTIDLPEGLPRAIGEGFKEILPTGINFPPTGVNPPVEWVVKPPAKALQELAERYGRRVVYRLSTDSVHVARVGEGAYLPDGNVYKQGPSLKSPEAPDAIGIAGAPTRHDMKIRLEAVGEDWDGMIRPIDQLSYAPRIPANQPQVVTFTLAWDLTSGGDYQIQIDANANLPVNVIGSAVVAAGNPGGLTLSGLTVELLGSLAGVIEPNGFSVAFNSPNQLVVTGPPGVSWGYSCSSGILFPLGNTLTAELTQMAQVGSVPYWGACDVQDFAAVQATDRLTLEQARALAKKSVYKWYRVSDFDVSGPDLVPIMVPGRGNLVRRQQLVLTDTRAEQIVPQPPDFNYFQRELPVTLDLYRGLSRDQPARVYGSVYALGPAIAATGVYHRSALSGPDAPNTAPTDIVFVPFTIDPERQLVMFSGPVFVAEGPEIKPAKLTLQTAVLVRDEETNDFDRFTLVRPLAGQQGAEGLKIQWASRPDVQLNVIGDYNAQGLIVNERILEDDPIRRSNYYLDGLALQYNLSDAQTVEFNGVRLIDLDGAIAQVTWSIGAGGTTTTASRNTEHHFAVPPYPARRRAENIPSLATQAAMADMGRALLRQQAGGMLIPPGGIYPL